MDTIEIIDDDIRIALDIWAQAFAELRALAMAAERPKPPKSLVAA